MRDLRAFVNQTGPVNGIGMHYFSTQYTDGADFWIPRMTELGVQAVTTLNRDLPTLQAFKRHGIKLVVCRPFRRWYQEWSNDGSPVQHMQQAGYVPIVQIDNEDILSEEGDGQPYNGMVAAANRLNAAVQVYNQGGYVGFQVMDYKDFGYTVELARSPEWRCEEVFERCVLIPHPYGLNHPPTYQEDDSSFLGFLWWAKKAEELLGFVPPMIAGEMGWCIGASEDNRYPVVTPELHAQYAKQVFESFRTGMLPNGQPLPDYLIACCWWILGASVVHLDGRYEAAAIYKADGSRLEQFVQAVKSIPPFVRKFSWDREPEEEPTMTLAEAFPSEFATWVDDGGDPEESFRSYLQATGRLPVTPEDVQVLVQRTQAHVGEVAAIAARLPKNP